MIEPTYLVDTATGELHSLQVAPQPLDGLSPPELAARANEAHVKVGLAGEAMVAYAVEAGEALLAAKSQVRHGEWLPWLNANFKGSQQTSSVYMRLANYQSTSNFTLDAPSIVKALEAPSTLRCSELTSSTTAPVTGA